MRIIFAGTPDFAIAPLHALLERHDVVAVFTQPDRRAGRGKKMLAPPVKSLAAEHNIPVHQPLTLKDQGDVVQAYAADVMVVVAYGMILPQKILDIPRLGCLNIHASLLPRWRGAAPIQRAIEAGDTQTGVAIMQMQAGLDTGPVYTTLTTPITDTDTSAELHSRLSELGAQGLLDTLSKLEQNANLAAQAQNEADVTYAHKISKAEAEIDWTQDASAILRKINAFNPWPICQSHHQGNRLRIWQARAIANSPSEASTPGTIVALDDAVVVQCGNGALAVQLLQRDGSKPLPVREFRNGYKLHVGDVLAGQPTE